MVGPSLDDFRHTNQAQKGIIQRILDNLFMEIQLKSSESTQFLCKCSFLEIYNERISDLLDDNRPNTSLRLYTILKVFFVHLFYFFYNTRNS